VGHYALNLRYQPATDRLAGVATIRARATVNLSRFNLHLDGLQVHAVRVDGRRAAWRRHSGELTIEPDGTTDPRLPFRWGGGALLALLAGALLLRRKRAQA
jgi:aminopeptidase N